MLFCSLLFLAAVILKISGVPGVAGTVTAWIDEGSVEEALAVLGMSVTDAEYAVTEAFSSLLQGDFSGTEPLPVSTEPEELPVSVPVIDTPIRGPELSLLVREADPFPASDAGQVLVEDVLESDLPQDTVLLSDSSGEADVSSPPLPDVVSAASVSIDFSHVSPVTGAITSAFGYRDHPLDGIYKFHYGVDVAASEGTAIRAFADGTVNTVLQGEINGNYFKVQHADGIVSMYAHCQKILVKAGQRVKKGDVIAYVGQTGKVSGPHLHFQLYKDGKIIDPTDYIEVSA